MNRIDRPWHLSLLVPLLAVAFQPAAVGQWSSDPQNHLVVGDGNNDQAQPKVRAVPDGGVWISWYDNAVGGYRPTIQRLTSGGQAVFPHNGIQLAPTTNSSTVDYDLKVDAAGNAIITFMDNSSGTQFVTVQKVLLDGSRPWGAAGVQMPSSTGSGNPKVAVCADGTIVAAWSVSSELRLLRLDPATGAPIGSMWTHSETGRALAQSDLQAGNSGGDVILLWVRAEGTNIVTSRKGLKIQKWDSSAAPLWGGGQPLDVYTSSASPSRGIQSGYFPVIVPDGAGGAIVAWYDIGATRNAWVQHVLSDGTLRFPADGVAASTTPSSTELRLSAAVAYDSLADEYVVAYETSNTLQSLFGVGAQRITAAGTGLWGGGAGAVVLPVAGFHASFINALPGPSGSTYLAWMQYTGTNGPMEIQATRLLPSGSPAWSPAVLAVATQPTNKARLNAARLTGSDAIVAAWTDGATGNGDVLAARINGTGTLGNPPCPADADGNGQITPADVATFVSRWVNSLSQGNLDGDFDGNGSVTPADVAAFVSAWFAAVGGGC
jgi:hypothetical protein